MPEIIHDRKVFSLIDVTRSIRKTLSERYKSSFWVKAEMIRLNHYKHSGHCYPDLVEKTNKAVIAQIKANLWKDDYLKCNKKFLEVLKEPLRDGIKILFLAKIVFEPTHGLSLRILDIDASYTLGDLEQEKQAIIHRLKTEGIFDRNKRLMMPLLPQRIAVISVETSKGYADFLKKIADNPWQFKFFHFLFPSVLQGDNAAPGIIAQLKRIRRAINHFDVAVIIRGGGGDVGLSCYNDYRLAQEVALFPIPVLTGIGHSTNETIVEMISHRNAITPTDLADYLIQTFNNFLVPVQKAEARIKERSTRLIMDEKRRFQSEIKLLKSAAANISQKNSARLKGGIHRLAQQTRFIFKNENNRLRDIHSDIKRSATLLCRSENLNTKLAIAALIKTANGLVVKNSALIMQQSKQIARDTNFYLQSQSARIAGVQSNLSEKTLSTLKEEKISLDNMERNINNMDPQNVLKRGFSMTLLNGKPATVDQAKIGDALTTVVYGGNMISKVESINKTNIP